MRILYIDIDTLRPDHLGCYGYPRNTSPNLDGIAADAVRFENCYVSDAPCMPSRTALFTGRFGIHTGVIGHGGTAADPFVEGRSRRFTSTLGKSSWMHCLRLLGLKTVTISPFGERHSAWHWYANFSEIYNPGKGGYEIADDISTPAIQWIMRNGKEDHWFLHVNFWDPHTPYRTPASFGDPFVGDAPPTWLTEEVRQQHWMGCGAMSAQEGMNYGAASAYAGPQYPRQPDLIHSMDEVRRMFNGYDTGIRYADEHVGRILDSLASIGVLEQTAIIVSADHGENLGELNIYYDHHTADQLTTRVPLIVRWPGIASPRVDWGFHYQVDFAATVVELLGGTVPANWDGRSFADAFKEGREDGRSCLVLSHGAHTCQRSVRFDDYICIRSYHDGYHCFPDVMLFNLNDDPHEQRDLAKERPQLVEEAGNLLAGWHADMMRSAVYSQDPMWTVLREGGPYHTQIDLHAYFRRLQSTGREECAAKLAARYSQTEGKGESS